MTMNDLQQMFPMFYIWKQYLLIHRFAIFMISCISPVNTNYFFNITHSINIKCFQVLLCITNYSIRHHLFTLSKMTDHLYFYFLTIQFSLTPLHSLNVKQFYLTYSQDPIRCYYSESEWTWDRWQWMGTLHSSKLNYYLRRTIRMFSFISRTLVVVGSYLSADMQSAYSTAPADWALKMSLLFTNHIYLIYTEKHDLTVNN